ncbi:MULTISPECIES: saccharopine dehydrogenase family protein [Idiomarinaceae]|uniref:Carboxynorspermidine dehydrogenase n=4 Tax=Pseudidiomarina TaxID=2800384 RepID=A0A368UQ75_9GAMM|nr:MULTISPECIES: saccharopine dehydrogenase family protein [Idiomarinaceae]MDT7526297.1 saccharopine dehydrogenase family protein [Pseudidiomarina sp. GXY010]MDX1526569.1 saccharopine dehydrogenase family protein [Pseudidiomarina maritima]MRJ43030.1 saccharopine dehydrogenase family protein [Idiomarina sp. FeN1]NCU58212.1 saccharopine dehydrogenase family protein [Idiomarina sp. FenA--70]NCU60910.1 saccharopine dehydrogenase family protein [Idiomarina sp. FenBw--71]
MSRVLIIGAGGVAGVVVKKCAMLPEYFSEIHLASRTLSKCETLQQEAGKDRVVGVYQVDADNADNVAALIRQVEPSLVINVALPYQDLPIMDACLETGVHYLDTANYEPKDEAKFEYSWQWAYQDKFKEKGIMALLGAGFDPGVTNVFTAYAAKHYFDEIHYLDIVDCNGGDHGQAFATNFNPEINIREITQRGKFWENGEWHETDPISVREDLDYPNVGVRPSYLLFHEELESLVKHFPTLKRARFWMTFGDQYLTHLRVLENVGMTSIQPIEFQGQKIVPLEFLKAVLPNPGSLAEGYTGLTCIGTYVTGIKDGQEKTIFIYNNCDHAACNAEVGAQAVSYTTGVPAMIAASMMLQGHWLKPGVWNMEQFDPDEFMNRLNQYGLPWQVVECESPFKR